MTDEKRAEIERLATDCYEKKLMADRMGNQCMPTDPEEKKRIGISYELAVAELNEAEGLLREAQKVKVIEAKRSCFSCNFSYFGADYENNVLIKYHIMGQCRNHSPKPGYYVEGHNVGFPEIDQNFWCGDYIRGPERISPTIKKT
jgi:hypothetical protein